MELETLFVHGAPDESNNTGAVSVPIYQSTTFSRSEVGQTTGYDYARLQNPTRKNLEDTVAKMEGGDGALAFASGMAAIATMMELFSVGDHIIATNDLYGGTIRLFNSISAKNGLKTEFFSSETEIEGLINENTKAIFCETPSNPMMNVFDIALIAGIAKKHGLILIVDNTFLTPYFQQPLALGADIVVHSGTKYLCGHNDALAGFLAVKGEELLERLRFIYKTTGPVLAPLDSWLLIRGIKTLAIRMDRQQQNAMELARWLEKHEKVTSVFYIGLPSHQGYGVSKRQSTGFGAMISFHTDKEETALNLLKNVKIILFAESLGGVESLITYPMTQTHADVPEDERESKGINGRLLRLSIGIENIEDLKGDLAQALK